MASSKGNGKAIEAQAITPERAGFGRSVAIVPGDAGVVFSAAKRIGASTNAKHGSTLGEVLLAIYAQGGELWSRPFGVGDLSYEVRAPKADNLRSAVRGTMHVCTHTANKGAKQACSGHGKGESCAYTFVSLGDSRARWYATGYAGSAQAEALADAKGAVQAARATLARRLAALAPRFGAADMLATPGIAQAVALLWGDATPATLAQAMGKAPRKASTPRKAGKAQATPPEAIAAAVEPAEAASVEVEPEA